eukprot:CAMPEP_0177609130 /NCGR_PEP_ID=MMETSP0419_2-20121207/18897_1 /TAXON_ID=582737 /ORGANISM="Tetraselmis sp., Strain GSL018" /LENGTH=330 /DNA_ID=CAMNT_0019103979 /DNA_START=113 /DNA_END=1104 /DNA_ORIENTATION=+
MSDSMSIELSPGDQTIRPGIKLTHHRRGRCSFLLLCLEGRGEKSDQLLEGNVPVAVQVQLLESPVHELLPPLATLELLPVKEAGSKLVKLDAPVPVHVHPRDELLHLGLGESVALPHQPLHKLVHGDVARGVRVDCGEHVLQRLEEGVGLVRAHDLVPGHDILRDHVEHKLLQVPVDGKALKALHDRPVERGRRRLSTLLDPWVFQRLRCSDTLAGVSVQEALQEVDRRLGDAFVWQPTEVDIRVRDDVEELVQRRRLEGVAWPVREPAREELEAEDADRVDVGLLAVVPRDHLRRQVDRGAGAGREGGITVRVLDHQTEIRSFQWAFGV